MKKEYPPFLAKISSVLFGRTGRTARLGGGGGSREAGHFVFLRFSHVKLASNRFDVDNFTFISHNKTMIIDDGFISSPPASTSPWIFKFSTFFFQFFSVKLSSPPPAICMHSEHITCQFPYRLCDFICKIHRRQQQHGIIHSLKLQTIWKFVLKLKYFNFYILIVNCDGFHHTTANVFIRFRSGASRGRQLKTQLGNVPFVIYF